MEDGEDLIGPLTSGEGTTSMVAIKVVRTENGPSQGQILALTGLYVPGSLDSGRKETWMRQMACSKWSAVERIWHMYDSQGQILALASRPTSGLGFQIKVHKTFQVVPSSLGSG